MTLESSLKPGRVVDGRFRLERVLGEGSFGDVWLAERIALGPSEKVALKILKPRVLELRWVVARFLREVAILGALDHPNIARALDWSTTGPTFFLALELLEGRTLHELMEERAASGRGFDDQEALTLLRQLTAALEHAHERKIVHRDLKPRNIMVVAETPELQIKVLDFGVSKILEDQVGGDGTTVGRLLGSPAYMAPEQIKSGTIDDRTDVFSLAVLMFEVFTMRRPFLVAASGAGCAELGKEVQHRETSNHRVEVFSRVCDGKRPRLEEYRPDLPRSLSDIFERAMAQLPSDRFATVRAFEQAASSAFVRGRSTWAGGANEGGFTATFRQGPSDATRAQYTQVSPREPEFHETGGSYAALTAAPGQADTWPSGQGRTTLTRPSQIAEPDRRWMKIYVGAGLLAVAGATAFFVTQVLYLPEPIPVLVLEPQPSPAEARPKALTRPELEATEEFAETPREVKATDPPRKRRNTEKASEPARVVAPEKPRGLEALLARAKANPNDRALLGELARAITRAAEKLPEGPARAAIMKKSAAASVVGDLEGLEGCVQELSRARASS
jgi:serine/threonine protein kinase